MKRNTGGLTLPGFRTNHESLLINTADPRGRARLASGRGRRAHREALTAVVSGERSTFSINSARKTGYPQAKSEVGRPLDATHET